MNAFSFRPPQSLSLSDQVIGEVVVRRAKRSLHVLNELDGERRGSPKKTSTQQKSFRSSQQYPPKPMSSHPPMQCSTAIARGQNVDSSWDELNTAEKALLLQRQRCRRAQQKYRQKNNEKTLALEDAVVQLQKGIQHLKTKRSSSIPPPVSITTTPWKMLVEYFRFFRTGLDVPEQILHPTSPLCLDENHAQKKFLQMAMASDIAFNRGYGVDAMLEDWRVLTLHHKQHEIRLVRLDHDVDGMVVATLNNSTTITENMLRSSLPDLMCGGDPNKWHPLVRKLLEQCFMIPATVRFEWDDTRNRFVSAHYEADMLTPLLKLLGNLEDASIVLNSTLGIHYNCVAEDLSIFSL
ncbi:hypothetical protein PF005_g1030 [Phytophthora fragariae]|uniref:BZIP domain-containing protein n=3 Tax=Phytophthora fragariae TaxID=53985 RepID=A0A6A4AFA8_9STRA|nr:hypothetical protein PF003_g33693 [Phytophthora fragariae]KAE8949475.1 hypothetical protein PF009_g965 [Phytophthora fragariae]KAE9136216.1 hypothetical protein PF010_g1787 [Phytophthora fragariae]KAE9139189.1 hypothetical protein PF007_g1095 [Phytophthora fragariae]KAE9236541.1 hypothetical protein PF005_g1030 [Phytophthora fragariae]